MLRVALVQSAPVQGDVDATLQQMEAWVSTAACRGAQWVVFPELFITGYLPELWSHVPTPEEEDSWLERVQEWAARHDVWIVVGHPSYRPNREEVTSPVLFNAASLISPGGIVGTYSKAHLFGTEPDTFEAGSEFPVWSTPWGKVALQICYDLEFPEVTRIQALHGAELVICPSNNMSPFGTFHETFAMARAMENSIFMIYNNRIGPEMHLDFCGSSCVAHPEGHFVAPPVCGEALVVADIDVGDLHRLDPSTHYIRYRRPYLYGALTLEDLEGGSQI